MRAALSWCLIPGSEVKDLVEAWHGVKRKQHVNLDARVKEITLEGLCTACVPLSAPTDKLAQLKAAEVDKGVAKPFPFIEVGEFLPLWAEVVAPQVCGFVCCSLLIMLLAFVHTNRRLSHLPVR